jgi:riboflavin synthase
MFTGLVEEVGQVLRVEPAANGRRLWIGGRVAIADARIGDSIAVSGCCLTAVEIGDSGFAVDAVPETIARTTLGRWQPGQRVNLERALRLDQRLGGHLVQGHVDGVGEVVAVRDEGEGTRVTFAVPDPLARFVAEKGSIAIDGTSLTVAGGNGTHCEVVLVPHTLRATIAGDYRPGTAVNVEVDLVARYLARLLEAAVTEGKR